MDLEEKHVHEINAHTSPMIHIQTGRLNTNIKQEPAFYGNGDVAKSTEHAKYSGGFAHIIDVKTEVIGSDGYRSGDMNNTHGPTHRNNTIEEQIPGKNVTYVKPEPADETNVTNEFVIEIDTCKDEYYEKYGYPTNCGNVTFHNSEQHVGRPFCTIDTEPCTVGLNDTRNTNPDITTRLVQINEPGPTRVIAGPLETPANKLPRHGKSSKINQTYACPVCGVAFPSNSALNMHTLTHTGLKPYTCPVCGVGFTQKGHMQSHIRIHTGEKSHTCSVCEISFSHKHNLTCHMRTHTGEKPYKCSVCGVEFAQKRNLTTHMRIHTGEKPYMCSVCKSTFATNYGLISHTRIHTGEKPYKCSVCGFEFTWKSNLKIHMRIHTGEKPHKCSVCNGSFTRKVNLTSHMRSHSGGKPYKCT